jgi:hypothetical protein
MKLADMLPSKTIPSVNNRKGHALKTRTKTKKPTTGPAKKKARLEARTPEVAEADNASRAATRDAPISPASSFQIVKSTMVCCLPSYIMQYHINQDCRRREARRKARCIFSTKLSIMGQMALAEMMEMFTTAVVMVPTKCAQLRSRCVAT